MNRADIESVRDMIRNLPMDSASRSIVAEHFAYELHTRHGRLVPSYFDFHKDCARPHLLAETANSGPFAEAAERERKAFRIKESN